MSGSASELALDSRTSAFPARPISENACIACGDALIEWPYFENATIRLFKCGSCRSLTALPRPSAEKQGAIHDSAEYFAHPYFELRRHQLDAVERRCRVVFEKLGAAIDLNSLRGLTHLDVGCDTGDFVLTASRVLGTEPAGIDIAGRSVSEARQRGIKAECCTLEEAPENLTNLALLTAIDLIEHTIDPLRFMSEVRRRLRAGGVAYVETPNAESHIYRIGRTLSQITGGKPNAVFERLFPPEHIEYFSSSGLAKLAEAAGCEVVSLQTRKIPFADIGTSTALRVAATGAQFLDVASGDGVLLCLVIRRPR